MNWLKEFTEKIYKISWRYNQCSIAWRWYTQRSCKIKYVLILYFDMNYNIEYMHTYIIYVECKREIKKKKKCDYSQDINLQCFSFSRYRLYELDTRVTNYYYHWQSNLGDWAKFTCTTYMYAIKSISNDILNIHLLKIQENKKLNILKKKKI